MQLYNEDCIITMNRFSDESIDAIITSPPYWNQKAYSFWQNYDDYLHDVERWINECARVIKPGRHCFWIIPDKLPWPPKENGTTERLYVPIYADTERIASNSGLVCEFPIIWKKTHGTQKMFGSYPYPPTIIPTPMTERICTWRKPGRADLSKKTDLSKMSKQEWIDFSVDLWEIGARQSRNHPAIFPAEIPYRIIKLWSFVGDMIYDPFMGSGTTGVVCAQLGRNFIGSEINEAYFNLASGRLAQLATVL
jgi:modification methylase